MNTPLGSNAPNPQTFIDILLDETGSMTSCHAATVQGFNRFIADQRDIAGDCYLTLSKFDSNSIKTPYVNLPLGAVPELTFFPGGGTNLFDVVGERVEAVLQQERTGRSLIVILTDGAENCSQRFKRAEDVKAMVDKALMAGVSFLYFGAGSSAQKTAIHMGIPQHAITVFDTREMAQTMATISSATRAFRVET